MLSISRWFYFVPLLLLAACGSDPRAVESAAATKTETKNEAGPIKPDSERIPSPLSNSAEAIVEKYEANTIELFIPFLRNKKEFTNFSVEQVMYGTTEDRQFILRLAENEARLQISEPVAAPDTKGKIQMVEWRIFADLKGTVTVKNRILEIAGVGTLTLSKARNKLRFHFNGGSEMKAPMDIYLTRLKIDPASSHQRVPQFAEWVEREKQTAFLDLAYRQGAPVKLYDPAWEKADLLPGSEQSVETIAKVLLDPNFNFLFTESEYLRLGHDISVPAMGNYFPENQ